MKTYQEPCDIRQFAAHLAPALRAWHGSGFASRVCFQDQKTVARQEETQTVRLNMSDYPEEDDLYTALQELFAKDEKPEKLVLNGLGSFSFSHVAQEKSAKRLAGRICLVTGAAQGLGEGIAHVLGEQGATLIIADLNQPLAEKVAEGINQEQGSGTAVALKVDVGDEASVKNMMEEAVLTFGGIDLIVSNAGVLRAGGLEDMTLDMFEFVTRVNYSAFFLVTRYGSRCMKQQARFDPDYRADIVQINSKSGLEGSNRNFAYAGSKFGGIGLVQSFAKELVEHRIKVNAICPGNYYEGPLWRDPEKGLFVQYLEAGKVPGAKTVDDVYRFYVEKVPMRRGCLPLDVARAILYSVEQDYETGQAIPVTGGQNMLK